MAKLGSFQVARKAIAAASAEEVEADTFEFEGEEFRVSPDTSPAVPMMELADAYASTGEGEFSMAALAATWQMLKFCIHEDDFPRFRRKAMKVRADINDLMPVTMAVWEAATSRPTQGPSGSPAGPSTTSTSSKDASPSPAAVPPSPSRVGQPDASPSTPDLSRLTPANEWVPGMQRRPDMVAMDEQLLSIDALLAGTPG